MESEVLVKSLEAIGVVVLAVTYIVNRLKETKDVKVKTVLDLAIATVEEGVAFSEHANRLKKRETAINIGKQLKKEAVEMTKDPIRVERYMQDGLKPIRDIAHSDARNYIIKAVESIKDSGLKGSVAKLLNNKTIDQAINMQVHGPKCGVQEPLKSFLYREM